MFSNQKIIITFIDSNVPVSVIQIPDYLWFYQLVMWKFANYLFLI